MTVNETCEKYLTSVKELYYRGDATEHSYRPALQQLVHDLLAGHIAINERKRVSVGAPDLVIFKRDEQPQQTRLVEDIPLGFIEAKDIVAGILDRPEHQEQVKRYMELGNVVHTDGLEFRFYFNKELVKTASIARLNDNGHIVDEPSGFADVAYYLEKTIEQAGQTVRTAKSLALLMADRARPIRRTIQAALEQDIESGERTDLKAQYDAFCETLIHDLSPQDFADIYAETIAYGLFAARYNDDTVETFTLAEAAEKVPQTNPFLRQFFLQIAAYEKDSRLDWVLNNFATLFSHADVHKIMASYGKNTGMSHDPVTHFYETFLGEYDPKRRQKRGVYYTPLPVVQYIVRAVDEVLKDEFGLEDGLADDSTVAHTYKTQGYKKGLGKGDKLYYEKTDQIPRVQILDPATGTGTFLNETIKLVAERKRHLGSGWSSYVEQNLLPRLHGFEILMAAYSMAHMRLGLTLSESGYVPSREHPRIGVYLTNSLEEPAENEPPLLAMLGMGRALTEEAVAADKVKRDLPIMVVMGNPPYSGVSSNNGKFASELVNRYKFEPGNEKQKLRERTAKWLNDDYVKFISYAENMIQKNGNGIMAMITNHSFLDNPTFRGMRWQLMNTFDSISVIDLHGNVKKREQTPNGSKDENVFDIMQGVSIIVAVKKVGSKDGPAKVSSGDLWGKRSDKYNHLQSNTISTKQLTPHAPNYFFNKVVASKEYDSFISLNSLFPKQGVGITTAHDSFVIDQSKQALVDRFTRFKNSQQKAEVLHKDFGVKEKVGWDILDGWRSLQDVDDVEKLVSRISYRPFDDQYIFYEDNLVWRTVRKIMQHMQHDNIALLVKRQSKRDFSYAFLSDKITESCVFESAFANNSVLPLYVYNPDGTRTPNFASNELSALTRNLAIKPSPEDILDYIYATLHSPSYREKYKEFLKIDFPRVPVIENDAEFARLVPLGRELRELHLMHGVTPHDSPLAGEGNGIVEKLRYENDNVYINATQYFPNVPEIAWNFYIGGYQPAQKWLKDRKGRELTYKDIEHYQKIITILLETDKVMKEIG